MSKAQRQEITFREASIADRLAVARVHVQSWRESFTGIVPQAFLDRMSVEKRANAFEKGFASDFYQMFVAETQENGVVGFADFGKTRDSDQANLTRINGGRAILHVLNSTTF